MGYNKCDTCANFDIVFANCLVKANPEDRCPYKSIFLFRGNFGKK